jgi:hypothetical protein
LTDNFVMRQNHARNRASCRTGAERIQDKSVDVAHDPAIFRAQADRNGWPLHIRGSPMKKLHWAPAHHPVRILEALPDARCSLLHNQRLEQLVSDVLRENSV